MPRLRVRDRVRRRLTIACWGYLALVALLGLFMWTEGDAWWPASILLFGPRWLLILPAPVLLLAALAIRPRLMIPVGVAALITIGPVMGYRIGRGRSLEEGDSRSVAEGAPRSLRVITFNAQGEANWMSGEIPAALLRLEPDIIAIEECPSALTLSSSWPSDWTVRVSEDGICMATRFPVREAKTLEQVHTGDQGGTGIAAFFRLDTDQGPADLAVVHLETPRKGLEALRGAGRAENMEPNILVRRIGAARIRRWIDQQSHDVIIAGDFNMPVESRIYRDSFGSCGNAHSVSGRGFGWTRVLMRFQVRIDHVVTCGNWTAHRADVGPDLGSDHRPLIVDLTHPP